MMWVMGLDRVQEQTQVWCTLGRNGGLVTDAIGFGPGDPSLIPILYVTLPFLSCWIQITQALEYQLTILKTVHPLSDVIDVKKIILAYVLIQLLSLHNNDNRMAATEPQDKAAARHSQGSGGTAAEQRQLKIVHTKGAQREGQILDQNSKAW